MQQSDQHIIISGGGTGGHIFPAIAIAGALKERLPEAKFLFVGALGRMEMELVPKAGYEIEGLWISGLQRSLTVRNLSFPLKLAHSLYKADRILKQFKPSLVIGTGGYASGPLLNRAASMGIPSLIQEQNSYPGITNRLLAPKVDKICVAYEGMEKYFPARKIVLTGNPVRKLISDGKALAAGKEEARNFFGLEPERKTVLVVGGSLGALTLNESTAYSLEQFRKNGVQLIWQTGRSYLGKAEEILANQGYTGILAVEFIQHMELAYAAADLVVSRAGAIAISELCCIGKPSILIPSPNVAEDHQTKNARALADKGAAIIVKDNEARKILFDTLIELLNDEGRMSSMARNIGTLSIPDADQRIAAEAVKLLKIK